MDPSDSDLQSSGIEIGRPDSTYADRPRPTSRRLAIGWSLAGAVIVMLVAALFTPALKKPRVDTNEGKCMSNMHQIGLAIFVYANDFNGNYPEDFGQLLTNEKLTTSVFVCPASNDMPATQPGDLLTGGHCSYVYLGRGLIEKTVRPTDVIAYDPPGNHAQGYNILFGDAHVEAVDTARGAKLVAAAEAAMKVRLQSAATKPKWTNSFPNFLAAGQRPAFFR